MKIGLVGASNQEKSIPFDAQRTINLYPVMDEQGKEAAALYNTPGLISTGYGSGSTGGGRGVYYSSNGRAFVVIGSFFYEMDSSGVVTNYGTLTSTSGAVMMDENGVQLAICDGTSLYIFTYATNAFAKVTDVDLPSPVGTVTFIDGYFVVNIVNTGKFYISALYDGTSWNALDFATAESSPDSLVRVINAVGQLWLLGVKTTEVFSNTGASAFPFTRISGGKMEVGIIGAHTAVAIDNSIFFVGRDNKGLGMVYRANGFSPQRISNAFVERTIQYWVANGTPDTLRAWAYQEEGHTFYLITGGGMDTTLVFDATTQLWHERRYLDTLGQWQQHLAACGMFAFNKIWALDRRNPTIYIQSLDYYADGSEPMVSERTYTHISNENQRARFNSLEISLETGVGAQTAGSYASDATDPQATLWLSRDGGRTWIGGYDAAMGKAGVFLPRVVWRRIGVAYVLTFRVRISSPVPRRLIGSYLQ
jgi:Phage stabilisation protein